MPYEVGKRVAFRWQLRGEGAKVASRFYLKF